MRVAFAFILLISFAMAFKLDTGERPSLEDEQDNEVTAAVFNSLLKVKTCL